MVPLDIKLYKDSAIKNYLKNKIGPPLDFFTAILFPDPRHFSDITVITINPLTKSVFRNVDEFAQWSYLTIKKNTLQFTLLMSSAYSYTHLFAYKSLEWKVRPF